MPSGYARYVLLLMASINFLNYVDRFLLPAVATSVQSEFKISDAQIGYAATGFTLVYAIAAFPFAFWGDRGLRRTVIATGIALWSAATLATGFVRAFPQLVLTRAILGVGEASYYPAGTSLLGDLITKESRNRAASIWQAGSVFGIAVGFTAGGLVAAKFGWRTVFFISAVPGFVLAILALFIREPARGSVEKSGPRLRTASDANLAAVRRILSIRTIQATIASQVLLFWVLGALGVFLPLYVHRRFGFGVGTSATLAGGILVAGGLAGTLMGGWVADRMAATRPRAQLEVGIAGMVLGSIFVTVSLTTASTAIWVVAAFIATTGLYLYSAPFTAIDQNVVIPSLRATAVMVTLLIAHLLGDSWSASAVGLLSDSIHSLGGALLVTTPAVLILAAAAGATGLRHVADDTRSMEEEWARRGTDMALGAEAN
jgi:MFS family permease